MLRALETVLHHPRLPSLLHQHEEAAQESSCTGSCDVEGGEDTLVLLVQLHLTKSHRPHQDLVCRQENHGKHTQNMYNDARPHRMVCNNHQTGPQKGPAGEPQAVHIAPERVVGEDPQQTGAITNNDVSPKGALCVPQVRQRQKKDRGHRDGDPGSPLAPHRPPQGCDGDGEDGGHQSTRKHHHFVVCLPAAIPGLLLLLRGHLLQDERPNQTPAHRYKALIVWGTLRFLGCPRCR
mmetsp:Transcript_77750/g.130513  ORF Transcript_77750/g.130513 Transcript_77750/m.130513 type:complete len:236 (-) Transcript_77750:17-724(-)